MDHCWPFLAPGAGDWGGDLGQTRSLTANKGGDLGIFKQNPGRDDVGLWCLQQGQRQAHHLAQRVARQHQLRRDAPAGNGFRGSVAARRARDTDSDKGDSFNTRG